MAKEILGGIHSGMYEMDENKNSSIDGKYLGLALASRPLFVIWLEEVPLQVLLVQKTIQSCDLGVFLRSHDI